MTTAGDPATGPEPPFEIFLAAPPGLEPVLADEARAAGFDTPVAVAGGVTIRGDWPAVWRANLDLRGAGRVLVRLGAFRAVHLAQLDKRARRFPWGAVLRPDRPVRVEAVCRRSRIYHAGAAAQRLETAIREELGAPVAADAAIRILARIEDDRCVISLDSSGAPLHKRGHKPAVAKAPMRETLAALFLRQCGYRGTEPVVDPMCGAGSFVIEAAEIAAGLAPGRARDFAFEQLATAAPDAWQALRAARPGHRAAVWCVGSDRDAGAVRMSRANAERAGIGAGTRFVEADIRDIEPPAGPPGLVIVNPPYGTRTGDKAALAALHAALGARLRQAFAGWRVGLVTSAPALARATDLPFRPPGPPVPHGGLTIRLYQTAALD